MKNISFLIIVLFILSKLLIAQPIETRIVSSDRKVGDDFGFSLRIDGNFLIVGKPGDDQNALNAGAAYIFEFDGTSWIERAKLTASDGAAQDRLGTSVSISGDYAIVGARRNNNGTGAAYIFNRQGNNWLQVAKLKAEDGNINDEFGCSVRISGNYSVVGSVFDDDFGSSSGSAYVFVFDGLNWTQLVKLVPFDGAMGNMFGCSVSISGQYVAIGSYGDDSNGSNAGSVYVYHKIGDSIILNTKLVTPDQIIEGRLGYSVSISDNYLISGAYQDNINGSNSGSAYIYTLSDTNWVFEQKLTPSDGAAGDNFGKRVFISDDIAVVGAPNQDYGRGKVYVFKKQNSNWEEVFSITPSNSDTGDLFGSAVSVYGNRVVSGSPKNQGTGAAFIYNISGINSTDDKGIVGSSENFILNQNYPNPFNPSTKISFQIPKASNVKISVFNSLGEEILQLLNEFKAAGTYELKFDSSVLPDGKNGLSSGIYFYNISTPEYSATKKMIYLK